MVSYFRGKQRAVTSDMGKPFRSPKKKRPKFAKEKLTWKTLDPTAERTALNLQLQAIQEQIRLDARMAAEKQRNEGGLMSDSAADNDTEDWDDAMDVESTAVGDGDSALVGEEEFGGDVDMDCASTIFGDSGDISIESDEKGKAPALSPDKSATPKATPKQKKRLQPSAATHRLHLRWEALLPTLINDYLQYAARSFGSVVQVVDQEIFEECPSTSHSASGHHLSGKTRRSTTVLCLYFDHFKNVTVHTCPCRSLQQVLVTHGLFPTAPSQTRIAVSTDLLLFHSALFERSCDAINALALSLNSFYSRRGFDILDKNTGEKIKEPFRKSLGYAAQWFDVLRLKIENASNDALAKADEDVKAYLATKNCSSPLSSSNTSADAITESSESTKRSKKSRKKRSKADRNNADSELEHDSCSGSEATAQPLKSGSESEPPVQPSKSRRKKKRRRKAADRDQQPDLEAQSDSEPEPVIQSLPNTLDTPGPQAPKHAATSKEKGHPLMPLGFSPPTECNRRLTELCPACFGGNKFGRSLISEGGDFHISTDGNFHHRHSVHAGAGVPFHKNPRHIIPSEFVDKVGEHILSVRKQPASAKRSKRSKVPDSALDECERSYEAANGDKKKGVAGNERYDDQGLMSLVCRHDVPLFFANIDTPGEQQKYALALILWFIQFVPKHATLVVLYDIGCVVDRSVTLYDILPRSVLKRIRFTTTAMHAYGHQWSCQLMYNPRLCKGLGLTDGEGVERTWSKTRKLIGIVRSSSRARRIWVLDRQISSIATETRKELGTWIKRRLRDVELRTTESKEAITKSGHKPEYLRQQWKLQKKVQLSAKSHTPTQVKAEINCVLMLQEEIENLEARIRTAKKGFKGQRNRKQTRKSMDSLQSQLECLVQEVEELFSSLKIHRTYPELKGLGADFVRTLILASELKQTIRRQAIESFFELERLDQAVGGRHQALGTKLHQQTRQAMNKRSPALVKKIKKFNSYCEYLRKLLPSKSKIALPKPLSTKVAQLRDDPVLMQDVWITSVNDQETTPWMDDPTVRTGIQAVLKYDRCLEERRRIGTEADNMCRQFGRDLLAAEVALRTSKNAHIARQLTSYRNNLHHLKPDWTSSLASAIRYESHIQQSLILANNIAGSEVLCPVSKECFSLQVDLEADVELMEVDEIDVGQSMQVSEAGNAAPEFSLHVDELEDFDDQEDSLMLLTSESDSDSDTSSSEDESGYRSDDTQSLSDSEPDCCADSVGQDEVVQIVWEVPEEAQSDQKITADIKTLVDQTNRLRTRDSAQDLFRHSRSLGRLIFEARDLRIMNSLSDLLNDVCLNGCAHLLQLHYTNNHGTKEYAQRCAIFTTYDLVRWRLKRKYLGLKLLDSSSTEELDSMLWKNSKRTDFWSKDVWILPIHRPSQHYDGHWVLCVAYPREGKMYLYDSFAEQESWNIEAKELSIFFSQIVTAARGHIEVDPALSRHPTPWVAVPALTCAVQSNGYDCGLWVLVWIAVTLRGYQCTDETLSEGDMPMWRKALLGLILQNTSTFSV